MGKQMTSKLCMGVLSTLFLSVGCITAAPLREAAVLPVGQVEISTLGQATVIASDALGGPGLLSDVSIRAGVAEHMDAQVRGSGLASIYYQILGEPTSYNDIDVTLGAGLWVPTIDLSRFSGKRFRAGAAFQLLTDLPVGESVTINGSAAIMPSAVTTLFNPNSGFYTADGIIDEDLTLTFAAAGGFTWHVYGGLFIQPSVTWTFRDAAILRIVNYNNVFPKQLSEMHAGAAINVGFTFGR